MSDFIVSKFIIIKSHSWTNCQFGISLEWHNQSLSVYKSVEFYHFLGVKVEINAFDWTEMLLQAVNYSEIAIFQHLLEDRSHRPDRFGEVETSRDGVFNEEIEDSLFDEFDVVYVWNRRGQLCQALFSIDVDHSFYLFV